MGWTSIVMLLFAPLTAHRFSHHDAAAPVIASLTPNTVLVGAPGLTVVIRGSGFASTAVVRWNGADRTTTYVSDFELRAALTTADFDSASVAQITVYVPGRTGGVSNAMMFIIANPPPTLASIAPTAAIAGAEPVTLIVDGSGFMRGALVRWNRSALQTTFVSSTRVTAVIPSAALVPGAAQVAASNPAPGGTSGASLPFTITHVAPTVSSMSPRQATALGSQFQLSLTGQNFVRSTTVVRWNNSDRPTTFVSPTSVTADITAADIRNAGTATITVVTQVATGTGTSAKSSANASFTINPAAATVASLQAITPTSQQGTAGAAVSQPPAVKVLDQNGNPVAGVNVAFTPSSGGSVTPAQVTSDAMGVARLTSWTLSPTSGYNQVQAVVTALQPVPVGSGLQPATFAATSPFTLVVLVKRTDGTGLDSAQVCVGSRTDLDQYAGLKTAGSTGRVIFTVPAASEYTITSAASGYIGQSVYQTVNGSSASSTLTLGAGRGGPVCPGTVSLSGATTIAIAPTPLADLDVDVTQANNPLVAGTQQTYHLKAYNRGGTKASNVVLRTDLPPDLAFSSANGYNGFSCTRSGTTLTCTTAALNAGDSAKVIVGMSLPLTATSGHSIQIASRIDPSNTVSESNESNNLSGAVALSQAVIAPVVDYIVTGATDINALFQAARAKGYQFTSAALDNDAAGNPVKCNTFNPPAGQSWLPRYGGDGFNPVGLLKFRCLYQFFVGPALPAGWQLRDATWRPGFPSANTLSMTFVQQPNTAAGAPFFTTQLVFQSNLTFMEITSIALRGPAGMTWRDAFK